jgi:hypothetical protein
MDCNTLRQISFARSHDPDVAFCATLELPETSVLRDMAKHKSTPADRVIEAFGGVRETARILDRNASSVSRWRKPLGEGGTGGYVPTGLLATVLREAKKRRVDLTAADLIGE